MNDTVVLGGMAATPVITALLQVVKPLMPAAWATRALPFVAVVLGIAWNVGLTVGTDEFTRSTIFLGAIVGLAASGLYSAGRSVVAGTGGP